MIKSLVLYDQEDIHTHYRNDEFVVGEKILVCPITEANAKGRRMYFPYGNWYNLWTEEIMEGGQELWVDADLDTMPVFVKEGAIIPKYPIQQYVGEREIEQVFLDIYYKKGKEKSQLYEDSHDGYDYIKGRFSLRNFTLIGKDKSLTIQQFKAGKFTTGYSTFEMKFVNLPFKIKEVEIDGEKYNFKKFKKADNVIIFPKEFSDIELIG